MSENALSPRQLRAVNALLVHPTIAAAAGVLGVAPSTIYRWLSEPLFRATLAQAEGEAVAAAGRRLAMLAETALDELGRAMLDPATPAPTRVRAAEVILNNLLRYREIVGFENRLTALEQEMRGEQ